MQIAKQGILQDYVTHEEALPRVRGRLLAYEQATRQFGQAQTLECRFDDLETDIPENQLLTAGLGMAKRVVRDEQVRRQVARAHATYAEVADPTPALIDPPAFDYNRRNERYRPAHVIARMLVESLSVNDLYAPGSGDSFAFLLDMNRLFEDFITQVLMDAFRDSDVRVRAQRRDGTLITDARTGRPYAAIIPDILLESGTAPVRRVPVDAKYKLYDERKIDQGDIYQTFFYAWAYADEGGTDTRRRSSCTRARPALRERTCGRRPMRKAAAPRSARSLCTCPPCWRRSLWGSGRRLRGSPNAVLGTGYLQPDGHARP